MDELEFTTPDEKFDALLTAANGLAEIAMPETGKLSTQTIRQSFDVAEQFVTENVKAGYLTYREIGVLIATIAGENLILKRQLGIV